MPAVRSMAEFAVDEIVLPNGPYVTDPFSLDYQPTTRLWFDAVDSGKWDRFAFMAPTQWGKTLLAVVIPSLYHLFEIGETVVCGVPDLNMAGDKWREDFLPVIRAMPRYADLLPTAGRGSRGAARLESVSFRNGATLRFMSGGGGDTALKGYTARVLVITEADHLDRGALASQEARKIKLLIGRTRAFGEETGQRPRIYSECTVTVERGYIWQARLTGTNSRVELPCPHCEAWVQPEREHLTGWQDAESEKQVRAQAAFGCPACGEVWTGSQRRQANLEARLMHARPGADTCGIRVSAVHNLFKSAGDLGVEEWQAARDADEEDANRDLCQQVWAVPPPESLIDLTALEYREIARRVSDVPRGHVPAGTESFTTAIDLGKWECHWVATAFDGNGTPHVVDYNVLAVSSHAMDISEALMLALREWRDLVEAGWPMMGHDDRRVPDLAWVDSGYQAEIVYQFIRESDAETFAAAKGLGVSQSGERKYTRPRATGSVVKLIGQDYHGVLLASEGLMLWEVNADAWKTWVHERLTTPPRTPGAMTLFQADWKEHTSFAKQLAAERQVSEFVAGKGEVIRWDNTRRRPNHYLDAIYTACAAGHLAGVRLGGEPDTVGTDEDEAPRPLLTMPDGRPFLRTR